MFQYIVAIISGIGAVLVTIFHIGTPEKYVAEDESPRKKSRDETSKHDVTAVSMNWSDWFREKHFFFVRKGHQDQYAIGIKIYLSII